MCESCNIAKETPINEQQKDGITSIANTVLKLPIYESKATSKQWLENLEFMDKQLCLIKEQHRIKTPVCDVKVRCGCLKMVRLYSEAYRCLYCGIWFCKECAQLHFGYRVRRY